MIRKHLRRPAKDEERDILSNEVNITVAWSDDKTTSMISNLEDLPDFMLKRLAEDVFEKMPKSKIKVWFYE